MVVRYLFVVVVALGFLSPGIVWAQEDDLTLAVHRTFGYGSGSQIQGNFRLEARGPDDLASVTFTLDDQVLATDTEAPFEARLQTGEHVLGWHELGATGETTDGRTLTAPARHFEFVSADQVGQTMGRIVVPMFAVLALIMLVSIGLPLLQAVRGKNQPPLPPGAPRKYGALGGTICPKCGRPFSRHWWGFNLIVGKLDRCDHCGRWSLARRGALPRDVLTRAEAAELAEEQARQAAAQPAVSDEEKRRRALEESRFEE